MGGEAFYASPFLLREIKSEKVFERIFFIFVIKAVEEEYLSKEVSMLDFLPEVIRAECLKIKGLEEVRLRANMPVFARSEKGFLELNILATEEDVKLSLTRLLKHSVYAYEDALSRGYVTTDEGERVGLGGKVVGGERVVTVKNVTSLCIRVPSAVKGCADELLNKLFPSLSALESVVIIAPPGAGKTTFLRDMAATVSKKTRMNVLVVDEKEEIALKNVYYGDTVDVIKGCKKLVGTEMGIRNLRPELIVFDEIADEEDFYAVKGAILSGVKVFASVHGKTLDDFFDKIGYENALIFPYFAVLSLKNGAGTIEEYGRTAIPKRGDG